ncbi:thioredoxin family protein [Thorsellia anophelis]|uniref:Putative thioredoxin n=1 Tax=Thorsellia anophelis DSM 18579 TaxID=1123402 RepID=A0A1I0EWE7_9GAMM|nr:co-chaperone YbbN [Thorsellia anophelis]SET49703.1 putative thioredoxin [Thorsellia anophelis DSM 18579]
MQDFSFDITTENIRDVLAHSTNLPVMFYFYSSQVPECQESDLLVEQLTKEHHGLFILAKVNCDEQMAIAQQFGLRALPTFYLFKDNQPVNAIQGPQTKEALNAFLAEVLPAQAEQDFNAAKLLLSEDKLLEALPLLRQALANADTRAPYYSEIVLVLAETFIQLNRTDEAENTLTQVLPQDRDSRYQGLLSQIELARKAADSPEIQQLQKQVQDHPDDYPSLIQLALQLHQVGRNEEALESLFVILKRDLGILDGEMKKAFMDILSALGTGDPLAGQYRRKIYSLLY